MMDAQRLIYEEYNDGLKTLLDYLNSSKNDVIGFFGSGLSVEYNYKTWYKLITGYNENGSKECDGLVDFAKVSFNEWSKHKHANGYYNLLKIAQLCYDEIGDEEKWKLFIRAEYDNINNIKVDEK